MSKMLQVNQFDEKEFWEEFRKELKEDEKYIEQERQESFNRLLVALDFLKGHEVIIDIINSYETYQVYEKFEWSLFKTKEGILKLTFEDEEESTPPIYFNTDEIESINIDDNSEYLNGTTEEQYEVEDIVITLNNEDILRLELQW